MVTDADCLKALRMLVQSSHLASPDKLPGLLRRSGETIGVDQVDLYLVDYDQVLLVPLDPSARAGAGGTAELAVDTTLAGRAFVDISQQVSTAGDGTTVWSPVLDGTERIGVIAHHFPAAASVDDASLRACLDAAAMTAELVISRSLYGDTVEQSRRRYPISVPAEMSRRMLPPLTFVSPAVAVGAVLAPAHELAGDTFDYAVNGDVAHVAIFDAMGHGLEAALMSSVAVSVLRNARRGGLGLGETVAVIEDTLAQQFGPDKFVTAIIGQLELSTGWWRWATCGHPAALLLRDGRIVKVLDEVVAPPLGLRLLDAEPVVGRERLQPGDRVVLYTDGVVEARDHNGEFFGLQRLANFITRHAADRLPVAETLRRLNLAILAHQRGALQDDATTVMIEWPASHRELSLPE